MNVSEASKLTRLLRWVTNTPGTSGYMPTTTEARDHAVWLTRRAHQTLAAGLRPEQVAEHWPTAPAERLQARINAALALIDEHDGPEAQHSEHYKWVSVRQALTGEAGEA